MGIVVKDPAPCARRVEDDSQLLVTFTVTFKFAVDQFDERRCRAFRGEVDFDFAGLGWIGIDGPVGLIVTGADVPAESNTMRRIPLEYFTPIALLTVGVALIPSAANARLNKDDLERRGTDVVRGRPPGFHLLHKY